jgi:hypothetical protein
VVAAPPAPHLIELACGSTQALYGPPDIVIRKVTSRDLDFERQALTAFAFIAPATAPRVIDSSYSPESFGNADIGLEGEALRVRVTRDRGQYFVTLSPRWTADWFDEHTVLQLVGAADSAQRLAALEWKSMLPAAEEVRTHLVDILDRFGRDKWPESRATMKRLREQRAREIFE